MIKYFQNSSGFFKTQLVSNESLISGVSNFDFGREEFELFTDVQLGIPERLMLGKRAERYFSEWLKRSSNFELIAENIQVIDKKRTLGEFDFILRRNSDGQLIHVELVYKFYLFDPAVEGSELEHWIGPNRGDQLDFKLDKLQNHQFPLLNSDAAQNKLNELKIDTSNIEQQVLFLVNLFVPADEQTRFIKVNKGAVEGTWMNLSDWKRLAMQNSSFAIPQKMNWFSRELCDAEWLDKSTMEEKIESMHAKKRSTLIYSKDSDGNQRRDFVVWW